MQPELGQPLVWQQLVSLALLVPVQL